MEKVTEEAVQIKITSGFFLKKQTNKQTKTT